MPKIRPIEKMRFDFPDDPLKGWVEIIHLESGDIQEITAKSHQTITRYTPTGPVTETVHDMALDRELTIDRVVKEWGNFQDETGQPMPCNAATKKLWSRQPDFCNFIADCRKKLAASVKEKREAEEKNS